MIEAAIVQYLKTQTSIASVVGNRIYPNHISQNTTTFPVITCQLISLSHDHVLGGAAGSAQARLQVDIWGKVPTDVVKLAEAIRQKMQGLHSTLSYTDPAAKTIKVFFVMLDNEQNLDEAPQNASDTWTFRRTADYLIRYAESVPAL